MPYRSERHTRTRASTLKGVLLGRTKGYPPGMYTCVSGFVEHGESVERAAARGATD